MAELSGRDHTTVVLRIGSNWSMAFSPHTPLNDKGFMRQVCSITFNFNAPRSYCADAPTAGRVGLQKGGSQREGEGR
ncbi:MAG: hypothetical protein ACRDWW_08700 [Acidimicrobiales bacterium]